MGVVATGGDSGGAPSLCTQCVCMRANGQDSLLKQIQNMGFRRGGAIADGRKRGKISRSPSFLPSDSRSIFSRLIQAENRRAFAKEAAWADRETDRHGKLTKRGGEGEGGRVGNWK